MWDLPHTIAKRNVWRFLSASRLPHNHLTRCKHREITPTSKMKSLCLIQLVVLFIFSNAAYSLHKVVLPSRPTPIQSFAASELNKFCNRIFTKPIRLNGKERALSFFVGYSKAARKAGFKKTTLTEDQFTIELLKDKIMLRGYDNCSTPYSYYGRTGTLSAVYYFLRKFCGVDFLFPDEDGILVPLNPKLNIQNGVLISPTPSFMFRGITFPKKEFSMRETTLFARRLLCSRFQLPSYNQRYTFRSWKKRFGTSHPEYFCEENGKKVFHPLTHPNPCFSNPAVLRVVVKELLTYFKDHPNAKQYRLFEDLPYKACQCANCANSPARLRRTPGDYGEEYFAFAGKVAEAVGKVFPDKRLIVNTKSNYAYPPELVVLPSNLIVNFITGRSMMFKQAVMIEKTALLKKWKRSDAVIYFRSYARMPKYKDYPIMNQKHLIKYILDAEGLTTGMYKSDAKKQVTYAFSALNNYLQGNLIFDVKLNTDKLIHKFLTFNFPGAETEMLEFYRLMEKNWSTQPICMFDPLISIYRPENLAVPMDKLNSANIKIKKKGYIFKKLFSEFKKLYRLSNNVNEHYKHILTKKFTAPAPQGKVLIDGILSPDEWSSATQTELTELIRPLALADYKGSFKISSDPESATNIFLMMDKSNLYIALKVGEPEMNKLRFTTLGNGNSEIRYDDGVELYFTNPASKGFYRLQYNVGGFYSLRKQKDINDITRHLDDATFSKAVKRYKDHYVIELKIPFRSFGLSEDGIRLNIIRNRVCIPEKFDFKDLRKVRRQILSIGAGGPYEMSSAATITK